MNPSEAARALQKKGVEKYGVEYFRKAGIEHQERLKKKLGKKAYSDRMKLVRRGKSFSAE